MKIRSGQRISECLKSPADGIIFFRYNDPLIYAFTSAFKILTDEKTPEELRND